MKKLWIIGILAAVGLIVFGTAGYALAQSRNPNSNNPTSNPNGNSGYGCGMYGAGSNAGSTQQPGGVRAGRGMMGGGMMGNQGNNQNNTACPMGDGDENGAQEYGLLHSYMYQALAQALGITPQELETRRQAGDTLWTIAQEKGLTTEQFQQMMITAADSAVSQAVADGVITQEQADLMLERMGGMIGNGYGPGYGGCLNAQP